MIKRVDCLAERQEERDFSDQLVADPENAAVYFSLVLNLVHLDGCFLKLVEH